MKTVEKKPARRRGPRPMLDEPVKLSTNITRATFDALAAYAAGHGISMALAVRRAIGLLTAPGK